MEAHSIRQTIKTILATVASLFVLAIILVPSALVDADALSIAYGYVFVNGAGVNDIAVNLTCNGSLSSDSPFSTLYDTGHNAGYYQFNIDNGSLYSVSATYNDTTSSVSFTAYGDTENNLSITFATPTPTPTDTPTPTPTDTATPTPTLTAMDEALLDDNSSTPTATITITPTTLPSTNASMSSLTSGGTWIVGGAIAVILALIAILGIAYLLLRR